jgi:Tfp pilus assembly protein PilX
MNAPRRASTLVVVLVALVITSVIAAELLRTVLLREHHARVLLRSRQAQLLAESGLERAIVSLKASPEYLGESWQPKSDDDRVPLEAEIKIEADSIVVIARVGTGPQQATAQLSQVRGEQP